MRSKRFKALVLLCFIRVMLLPWVSTQPLAKRFGRVNLKVRFKYPFYVEETLVGIRASESYWAAVVSTRLSS